VFSGVKRPRRDVDYPPHIVPRLKKEYSCTSTPPLSLRGLLQGGLYLYLYFIQVIFCLFSQFLNYVFYHSFLAARIIPKLQPSGNT